MKRMHSCLVLLLAPDRIDGWHLEHGDVGWRATRHATRTRAAREALGESLAPLVRELRPPSEGGRALVVLHHALTTWARTPVPNATEAERREFLSLWAGRHWPVEEYGPMRTAWAHRTGGEHAVVAAIREGLFNELTSVLRAEGTSIAALLPAAEALGLAARRALEGGRGTILESMGEGIGVVRLDGGVVEEAAWLPADESGLPHIGALADAGELSGRILVCGQGGASLRESVPALATADSNGWLAQGTPAAPVEGGVPELPPAVRGALGVAEGTEARLDFMGLPRRDTVWSRLAHHPKLGFWAAAAAVLLLLGLVLSSQADRALSVGADRQLTTIEADLDAIESNLAILAELESKRRDIPTLLMDLGELKPDGVMLTEFDLDERGNLRLAGTAPSYSVAEQFTVKLNESRRFRQFTTQGTTPADNQVRFSLTGKVAAQ